MNDSISANDLLKALKVTGDCSSCPRWSVGECKGHLKWMCSKIVNAPRIEAEPVKHGRWVYVNEFHIGSCSACGNRWGSVDEMHYCPSCGARMDEVAKNGND